MTVRGAAEIGAGLAPARTARPIRRGERIHVVGAQGAGASAAAILAAWAGADVDGCDPGGPSPYAVALDRVGIPVAGAHAASHLDGPRPPERVAVTKALTAIDPGHPELAAARAAAIPLEPWQQLVADAAAGRTLVGVAGTHGKSTTAGWLVHALATAGEDPGAFVGALLPPALTGIGVPATARRGAGRPFVVEADEYAGNFDPYRPEVIVLTSAEWDHPDVFADGEAVIEAFEAWIRRAAAERPAGGAPVTLVANAGDPGVAALVDRLRDGGWTGRIVRTGVDPAPGASPELEGRIVGAEPDGTRLRIGWAGRTHEVRLRTAGRHNASNALGVLGAAVALGVDPAAALDGVASFEGVGRRLERKGEARGVVVYDDYGHHPTAIRETLVAVRQREPGRRVWAVYEPLTYHRTAAMLDAFAEVLAAADAVAIADIWAGRDPDTTITSAAALAGAVRARDGRLTSVAPGSVDDTAAWLADHVREGDVVLVMGGGRSYRIGERLLEHLEAR